MCRGVLVLLSVLSVLSIGVAPAAARADLAYFGAGADARPSPEVGGNGFLVVGWQRADTLGGRLHLYLNTDTLHLGLEDVAVAEGVWVGAYVRAEALVAGVLGNYFLDGLRDASLGFLASYGRIGATAKARVASDVYVDLEARATQWLFGRTGDLRAAFVLPDDRFSFGIFVGATYWGATSGAAELAPHRLSPRLEGVVARIEVGTDVRSSHDAWGLPEAVERNDPAPTAVIARQSLTAGWRPAPWTYLRVREAAAYGVGADDVDRDRLGGNNPWVVPMFGAPWPAWLSERYVSGELMWMLAWGDQLFGPGVTAPRSPTRGEPARSTSTPSSMASGSSWICASVMCK